MFWQLTDSSISCIWGLQKEKYTGGKDGTMLVLRFPQCIAYSVSSTNLCSNPGPKPLCSILGGASLLLLLRFSLHP